MNKRGITKFWIEIIGGVIIVVLIIMVLLVAASTIGTAASDAQNSQEMNGFTGGLSDALTRPGENEHVISPFKFVSPSDGQTYAMVYLTPSAAQEMIDGGGIGVILKSSNKQVDLYKLKKCAGETDDACMCLFRLKYKSDGLFWADYCNRFDENLITSYADPSGCGAQAYIDTYGTVEKCMWTQEFKKIEEWNHKFLNMNDAIDDVVVVDCILLAGEKGCKTVFDDGTVRSCIIHYATSKGVYKPLVWLSTKKDKQIDAEMINISVKRYNVSLVSYYPAVDAFAFRDDAQTRINHGADKKPCSGCGC